MEAVVLPEQGLRFFRFLKKLLRPFSSLYSAGDTHTNDTWATLPRPLPLRPSAPCCKRPLRVLAAAPPMPSKLRTCSWSASATALPRRWRFVTLVGLRFITLLLHSTTTANMQRRTAAPALPRRWRFVTLVGLRFLTPLLHSTTTARMQRRTAALRLLLRSILGPGGAASMKAGARS